jgi:hypothetical protein
MWRDGNPGRELQKGMVQVLAERLFDHNFLEHSAGKSAFTTGLNWASFARVCGPPHRHMEGVFTRMFDSQDRWSDSVKAVYRAIWVSGASPLSRSLLAKNRR